MNTIFFTTAILNTVDFWNDQFFLLLGSVITSISVVVTVISIIGTIRSNKKSRPKYSTKSKTENDITVSNIVIWNSGKTIRQTDIAENAPIRITLDNAIKIKEAKIIYFDEPTNLRDLAVSEDGKHITFVFDIIRDQEGFVLKVSHTGNDYDLDVQGSLIEGGDFIPVLPYSRVKSWFTTIGGLLMTLLIAFAMFIVLVPISGEQRALPLGIKVFYILISLIFLPFFFIRYIKVGFSSMSIPKKLANWFFYEDGDHKSKFRKFVEERIEPLFFKPIDTKKINKEEDTDQHKTAQEDG